MRIAIGADHAGFSLKEHLKKTLTALGHQVDDFGTDSDASVDYPPICAAVGRVKGSCESAEASSEFHPRIAATWCPAS